MGNNLKGNKKKITAAVTALILCVAAVAGIAAGVRATTSSTVPVVPVSHLNYGEYLDWQNSVTGVITTDAEQNIYLNDTEVVEEVVVKEGQAVHKGDVLLRYDISSTEMNLEKEKINHEMIELGIEVAKQNIKTLENTSAISDDDDFGFFDDFDEAEAQEIIKKATVYEKQLKADAKPVNDDPEDIYLGEEDYPYVFLCKGDSVIITKDFIAKWRKTAKKKKMKHLYFELQTRDKALNLQKAWRTDVMLLSAKYDIEVDLSTGETFYSKLTDPEEMAKLLRKITKEIPEDERGAWLAVMMDKLLVTTEKEEKLKERGEFLASTLNELNAYDREEFAKACALLDADTLSTMFLSLSENLTETTVGEIDPDAVAGMITLFMKNMTAEQISAINPEALAAFLNKLTADQLTSLDTDVIGEILAGMSGDQLKEVMNKLLDSRQEEVTRILEEYSEAHKPAEDDRQDDDPKDGSGDDQQGGSGDDQQGGSGDDQQGGSGDDQQGGSGDDQQGGSDDDQQGGSDDDQQGSGDDQQGGGDDQQGSGDDQQGSGDDQQGGSSDDQQGSGDDQQGGSSDEQQAAEQSSDSSEGETTPSTAPSPSNDEGSSGGSSDSQLLSGDLAYTSDELVMARREARERLRDLELDLKESDLKIEQTRRALDQGVVKANMNGVVKTVGNPASPPSDGSPFLTVAGSEGLFVKSGVKESKLGTIKEGDIVSVTSWQTGGEFDAEIKSISPYPDTTGMFDGEQTETYYPFTANILDTNAEMSNGDWVEVSYTSSGESQSSGAMTIMKAFVREEGNKKYVYVRGDDNKLKKQYIITGSLSDSGYEVLDGLSESDWVAFPYGKNVKEGARTREGTLDELYG